MGVTVLAAQQLNMNILTLLLGLLCSLSLVLCHTPGSGPEARGPPLRRHQNIHLNLADEREHLKSMIKEEYINKESLDDNSLLMQYFKKHDADNNLKLDGLELLKALAKMDQDHAHDEEDSGDSMNVFDLNEMIPYVDTILREDDANKDGYISWAEFISRQNAP